MALTMRILMAALLAVAAMGCEEGSGKKTCEPACEGGEVCNDDGKCVEGPKECEPACKEDEVCEDGKCYALTQECDPPCEPHHVCAYGACYNPPEECDPPCEPHHVCNDGACYGRPKDCEPECDPDDICNDGKCVEPPRACEPACKDDELCDDGECVKPDIRPCCLAGGACVNTYFYTCLAEGGEPLLGFHCGQANCAPGCDGQTLDATHAAQLGGAAVGATLVDIVNALICGVDMVTPHSNGTNEKEGAGDHTQVHAFGALRIPGVSAAILTEAFDNTLFPCGEGPWGLTLCPAAPGPMPAGDYLLALNVTLGKVPHEEAGAWYQYGFVFDADGEATNNYQPAPAYPYDFFKDTDRWYVAGYDPSTGWSLQVTDASGPAPQVVESAARMVIAGDTIALVVPASEFPVPKPDFRVTAFRHEGDWGMNPPYVWSGDVEPPVASGLESF